MDIWISNLQLNIHGLVNVLTHTGVVLFSGQNISWATSALEQASDWAAIKMFRILRKLIISEFDTYYHLK